MLPHSLFTSLLLVLVVIATGYHVFSLGCAWLFARWRRRELARAEQHPDAALPPVTLLKPLRGVVPETYDNVANACRLEYPALQIVFGVQDPDDPAIAVVRQAQRDFPQVDIDLVVSEERIGTNGKVSNLHNMMRRAKHDTLVIADGDIRAPQDYLRVIVPYLAKPGVGVVTCPYRAVDGSVKRGLASEIEALFINTDFGPMVTVARYVEKRRYAFGATIGIRRSVLEEIGGFRAIADYLADDYEMGFRAVARGYTVELAPAIVDTVTDLERIPDVVAHQLRWARTYRACRPLSYLATIITHATFWATAYLIATRASALGIGVFAVATTIRSVVAATIASEAFGLRSIWRKIWLVAPKDLFITAVWAFAFLGNTVEWGGARFTVGSDGRMVPRDPGGSAPLPEPDASS